MDKRQEELTKLKTYIKGIDNELTMILQTLQWDRTQLLQSPALVICRYDSNHKVPPDKTEEHEKECFLRQNGYSKDDKLLPDPLDLESSTLVKLRKEDIDQIIANASRADTLFKRGVGCGETPPLSLERLQSSYSADERRAIHDAVVSAVPSCHDLTDLALLSGGDDKSSKVVLSRQEILLELRNMRRRRTKYRVAAKSRNYSDVLRDVIRTQMEHYNDAKHETDPKQTVEKDINARDTQNVREYSRAESKDGRYRNDGKIVPGPIKIKVEREDSTERNYRDNYQKDFSRERSGRPYRHETESRDRHYDRSRERRNYEELERSEKYGEHSRKRRHEDDRRNYYEDSEDKRKGNDPVKDHSSEKRSRKSHRHKDYDSEYERNDEGNHYYREKSQERRHDEKRDKAYKHKAKKERHRDRERSKERRRDKRYEDKSSERIHIKQERENSVTRGETETYDINTSKDRSRKKKDKRHEKSYKDDRNYDSRNVEVKQEQYDRYYDVVSEEIYDPHKKIKVEQ